MVTFMDLAAFIPRLTACCKQEQWDELLVLARAHDAALREWFETNPPESLTQEQKIALTQHHEQYQAIVASCAQEHENLRNTLWKWQQSKRAGEKYGK